MPAFGLAFCFVIDASKTPQRAFPSAATAAPLIGPSQAAWINSFGSGAVCTDEVRDLLQSLVGYIGDPESIDDYIEFNNVYPEKVPDEGPVFLPVGDKLRHT